MNIKFKEYRGFQYEYHAEKNIQYKYSDVTISSTGDMVATIVALDYCDPYESDCGDDPQSGVSKGDDGIFDVGVRVESLNQEVIEKAIDNLIDSEKGRDQLIGAIADGDHSAVKCLVANRDQLATENLWYLQSVDN